MALRSLLPSVLPSVEAVESRFKLLDEGVAPFDPEGVVFKDEAISVQIENLTALVKSLFRSKTVRECDSCFFLL